MASGDFADLVVEAEKAVQGVKDPELRRVAFDKVLERLMSNSEGHVRVKKKKSGTNQRRDESTRTRAAPQEPRGPKAYISQLIEDGFFRHQKTIADVKSELANRGYHIPRTALSGPLQSLTRERRLRRQKVRVNEKGAKAIFAYSNW